jgi:hypothetical protein
MFVQRKCLYSECRRLSNLEERILGAALQVVGQESDFQPRFGFFAFRVDVRTPFDVRLNRINARASNSPGMENVPCASFADGELVESMVFSPTRRFVKISWDSF